AGPMYNFAPAVLKMAMMASFHGCCLAEGRCGQAGEPLLGQPLRVRRAEYFLGPAGHGFDLADDVGNCAYPCSPEAVESVPGLMPHEMTAALCHRHARQNDPVELQIEHCLDGVEAGRSAIEVRPPV